MLFWVLLGLSLVIPGSSWVILESHIGSFCGHIGSCLGPFGYLGVILGYPVVILVSSCFVVAASVGVFLSFRNAEAETTISGLFSMNLDFASLRMPTLRHGPI